MESLSQSEELLSEIERLSKLDKIGYELAREEASTKYKIRIGKLDEFVAEKKSRTATRKSDTALFTEIPSWNHSVAANELLDEIVTILNRFVSFKSEHEPIAIALWVLHTYCIEEVYISPILFVTSAEMRSGKSTLLAILQRIVFKCISASSVSTSVIFRIIPLHQPTLVFDEVDSYRLDQNEDLRGIINAGHSRDTAGVLRTNPETLEPERFNAFSAKCLAGIKGLPGTIEDRSIIIHMKRMPQGHQKEKMRLINDDLRNQFIEIQSKCCRFASDNIGKIKMTSITPPIELNDRAADNWYALFQIAVLASDNWRKKSIKAALSLSGFEQDTKSLGVELLEDIQELFSGVFRSEECVTTAALIEQLCTDEEAPWRTYNIKRSDQRITGRQLAKLLDPYEIKSINNIGRDRLKGYSMVAFQDAFSRYIPTTPPFTDHSPAITAQDTNDSTSIDINGNDPTRSLPLNSLSALQIMASEVADSGCSGLEQIETGSPKPLKTAPHLARADRAESTAILGTGEYVEI